MILNDYEIVVVGVSAGGLAALGEILPGLPDDFPLAVVIVQHLHPTSDLYYIEHFNSRGPLIVKEAEEKEVIMPGVIYFASPNYHLLIERDKTFSFSGEEKVSYSRPSIDVLFESAATAFGNKLIGVVLTGANADGAAGLAMIKEFGGLTIVQDPATASSPFMPQSAIDSSRVDHILDLRGILKLLKS